MVQHQSTAFFVIPEAPPPAPVAAAPLPCATPRSGPLRLGLLDNNKANASHLLARLEERVRAELPVASVVRLRKAAAGLPAPPELMERLLAETDCVVTAVAD